MEIDAALGPADWTPKDREEGTERWHRAQLHLMCQAAHGTSAVARQIAQQHFKTIVQRTAFYNWFDQVRLAQGHEVVWVGCAWLVASQFARFDTLGNATKITSFSPPFGAGQINLYWRSSSEVFDGLLTQAREVYKGATAADPGRAIAAGKTLDDLVAFAKAGNRRIFEDVYAAHLPPLFLKGLRGQRLVGKEAEAWDLAMIHKEQREIIEPEYIKHVAHGNPHLAKVLNELLACEDFVRGDREDQGQVALCRSGLDVMKAEDRVTYGRDVVAVFYRKAAGDGRLAKMRPKQAYTPKAPITCG